MQNRRKKYTKKRGLKKSGLKKRGLKKSINRGMIGRGLIETSYDLDNRHICNQRTPEYRTSPAYELYTSISLPFQLNEGNLGYFMNSFKKSHDAWFKFVIFNNSGQKYIYVIPGVPINKHSVPLLSGLMELTRDSNEYPELRNAYNNVLDIKGAQGITHDIESNEQILQLNNMITQYIPCMKVISAGSGTIEDDNTICINTKSGHYKPTEWHMTVAKQVFEEVTGHKINVILHMDVDALKAKYGEKYEQMNGICP